MINFRRSEEVFESEAPLLDKVAELQEEGHANENIYVFARYHGDLMIFRSRPNPKIKKEDRTLSNQFRGFISGQARLKKAIVNLGLEELNADRVYESLHQGSLILYVDEGALDYYYKENSEFRNAAPETIPGLGTLIDSDSTPGGVKDMERIPYPKKGDHRIGLDGQNIRRQGDQVPDPDAEIAFPDEESKLNG